MSLDYFIRKILYLFDDVVWKFYYESDLNDVGILYLIRSSTFFLGKPMYVANDLLSLIRPTVFVFDINSKGKLVIKFGKMYLRNGKVVKPIEKVIITDLPKTDEGSLVHFATVVLPRIIFGNYLIDDKNNTLLSLWYKVCNKIEERERQLIEDAVSESTRKHLKELAKKAEEKRIKREKEEAEREKLKGEEVF